MSKKNNNIAYILIGIAAFMFLGKKKRQTYIPQQAYVPPRPSTAQAFSSWASAILSVYGNVSTLWQPGGPFHQFQQGEINDAINQNPTNDYDNPYLDDQGQWA